MEVLCWTITAYVVVCFTRVIFSFVPIDDSGMLGAVKNLSYTLTEPLFATVRRALPTPGDLPIDFAPAVILLVLFFLRGIVCQF
jgi:uncharacterized protein YggT (Ycf19 family)